MTTCSLKCVSLSFFILIFIFDAVADKEVTLTINIVVLFCEHCPIFLSYLTVFCCVHALDSKVLRMSCCAVVLDSSVEIN